MIFTVLGCLENNSFCHSFNLESCLSTELMSILVTSFGWLGQFVLEQLIRDLPDANIYVGYHSDVPILADAGPRIHPVYLDLTDDNNISEVIQRSRPAVVVHLAAVTSPLQCQKNPELCQRINQPYNLIESLKKHGLYDDVRFIFASTDHVYDGLCPMYNIGDNTEPVNNYGKSKLAYEKYLLDNNNNNQIVIFRLANIIGPMYKYKMKSGKFLQFLVEKCRNLEYILVKSEVRSFVYIHDCVQVMVAIAKGRTVSQPIYNLGGPESLSRLDLCRLVARSLGKTLAVVDEIEYINTIKGATDTDTWYVGMQQIDSAATLDSPIDVSMNSEMIFSSLNLKCHKVGEIIDDTTQLILSQLHDS